MMLKSSLINSLAPARQGSSGNDETLLDGGYADPDRVYGVAASALRDENNGFGGAGPASRVSVAAPPEQAAASGQAPAVLLDKTAATPPPIIQIQQTQPLTIDNGGTAEISGVSSQAVTFEGTTGTLKLDNAVSFTGQVAGLVESDALDLADVRYGADTTAVFSGNASGGTLTVTDGSDTAHISLFGDYLASGWTLSSDGSGGTIVVDPSLYPNATNTGVTAGTVLTQHAGGLTLSTPGQVISGLDISGTVYITASNVTLENCIIHIPSNGNFCIAVAPGVTGVTIQNCEIYGDGLSGTQVGTYGVYVEGDSQVTVKSSNIHDVGIGVIATGGQIAVENNYIHDFASGPGTHYEGVYYGGNGSSDFSLLVQDNTIENQLGQTAAVFSLIIRW